MSNAAANPGAHDNSLGFLRLALAALVVYGHAWYLGKFDGEPIALALASAEHPAGIAVRGFFAISGFLVMTSERRTASTRSFLQNRFLRIFPGLWLCLLLTGLLLPATIWTFTSTPTGGWPSAFTYVWRNTLQPRTQFAIDGLFPAIPYTGDLNGSLWTLPYEIGCYIALAAFGWTGLTAGRARGAWLAGGALLALYAFDITTPRHALFFKTEGRELAAWFIAGSLLALLPTATLRRHLNVWIAVIAALAWFASCHLGGAKLIGVVALPVIILWLAWRLPLSRFEQIVRGDYSYGLYIYAYPVQQTLLFLGARNLGPWLFSILSFLATMPFAILSWHVVEKFALRLKQRPRPA